MLHHSLPASALPGCPPIKQEQKMIVMIIIISLNPGQRQSLRLEVGGMRQTQRERWNHPHEDVRGVDQTFASPHKQN